MAAVAVSDDEDDGCKNFFLAREIREKLTLSC